MIDFDTFLKVIDKAGTIGLAVLVIVAFVRGWIVPRWAYNKLEKDCERMTEVALRGVALAERTTGVVEQRRL